MEKPEIGTNGQGVGTLENEDLWRRYFSNGGSPPVAIRDDKLHLSISELLVNVKVSRGAYNRLQVYGHVKVAPALPWVVEIPVGEQRGLDALSVALEAVHDVVTDVVQRKASELESMDKDSTGLSEEYHSSVEVTTPIRTIKGELGRRPSLDAAVGEPPDESADF